ncbi:DNA polymerase III subunit psi, partial [Klebsiella pneumoniae]|jgi:DNA polymerase-3 subunit psi
LGTEASLPLAGAQVSTPAFDELQTSAPARRALWQQICAHEHDFYPQHG